MYISFLSQHLWGFQSTVWAPFEITGAFLETNMKRTRASGPVAYCMSAPSISHIVAEAQKACLGD